MWSDFLRRKRTPPRKRRPDKRIPPRSFPSWEASSAVFFSLCSSGPVLQANLHTAAELRPLYSRCSWKVCHGKSSKCSVPSGLHWHLENQRSVPHRAADRSYPRLIAPFHFVRVQTAQHATSAIIPWTIKFFYWPLHQKGTGFFVGCNDWHPQKHPAGRRSLHWKMQIKGVWGTPQQAFCNAKSVFV